MVCSNRVIYALSYKELNDDFIYDGIWWCAKELSKLLSPEALSHEILNAIGAFQGEIQNLDGTPFVLTEDDDDLFGDADFRWMDKSYLAVFPDGQRKFYRVKKLHRVQMIDLYYQIRFPMSLAKVYR